MSQQYMDWLHELDDIADNYDLIIEWTAYLIFWTIEQYLIEAVIRVDFCML